MAKPAVYRIAYLAAGVGLGLIAIILATAAEINTGWLGIAFGAAPDIPLLFAIRRRRPVAARLFNVTHRLWGPAALAVVGLPTGSVWLVGAAAWTAHITLGRGLGDHLRRPDGTPLPIRSGTFSNLVRVLAATVSVVVAFGAVGESLAERDDMSRHPAPGDLVIVDGSILHLHCLGSGLPTVLLEAGLGESSTTWAGIHTQLEAITRTCAYDRAGYAWSGPGELPRTADRQAAELAALLTTTDEAGPYLMVGHSIGANTIRAFAALHPDQLAGMVLVDPTDTAAIVAAGRPLLPIAQYRLTWLLARIGVIRLFGASLVTSQIGADPPPKVLDHLPVVYRPSTFAVAIDELGASIASAQEIETLTAPGVWSDLPVIVITAGQGGNPEFGQRLASYSPPPASMWWPKRAATTSTTTSPLWFSKQSKTSWQLHAQLDDPPSVGDGSTRDCHAKRAAKMTRSWKR